MPVQTSLFQPGRNCWRLASAGRMALLIDAAAYYEAFALAAERVRRSLLIAAWDIDGRVRLRRERPGETLRRLLLRRLEEEPRLSIHILNWDFIWLYAPDRELLPWFDQPWRVHPRLHFRWDNRHPFWGSHHQKVVVLDDRLAFSGGLDFTDERWDLPTHYPNDRRRHALNRQQYKPFHDTMAMVEGPVARLLGDLVRRRWQRALPRSYQGNGLPVPADPDFSRLAAGMTSGGSLWPAGVVPDLRDVHVAIARTDPGGEGEPAVCEVERLFEDMIQAARRTIYIENQYFTADAIAAALARRLREPDGPEVVLVLPKGCTNWIEAFSMGIARWRYVRRLKEADRHDRFHVYYAEIDGLQPDEYIKVHSKVMIVDDRMIRIGSANLCNRSMRIDTECDLAIEVEPDGPQAAAIRGLRARLLGEHLGCPAGQVEAVFRATGSLAETIRRCTRPGRGLVSFVGEVRPILDKITPRRVPQPLRQRL